MLKKFVDWNKRISDRFSQKHTGFCGEENYYDLLISEIEKNGLKDRTILEAGGIDRPLLHKGEWVYDGLDIEYKPNCTEIYDHFFVQSIEDPIEKKYDLIISITLLEHVPDNKKSFKSIYNALNEGGFTIHYMPSKYHFYSILLRMIGPKGQRYLIKKLRPWSEDVTGYPTFFSECTPNSMKKNLIEQGFKNVTVKCFYRANDYFSFCFPLFFLVTLWENICKKLGITQLCSGFIISAVKNE